MGTQSATIIDLAAYYNQFVGRPPRPYLDDDYTGMAYLPYLVAVAEEVLDLGIQPISPEQLANATASAIRRIPVHALEASVVSMAMLAESLVETDAACTLIRRHLAVIGEALEANDRDEMGHDFMTDCLGMTNFRRQRASDAREVQRRASP